MIDAKSMIDLPPDLLRTFIIAADTGSFTRAAQQVHRTQSAVSMQIKRLETELNRPLFEREGRGVTLTTDGDTLYQYARRLLALHDEALAAITGPRLHGMIRFGAPEDYAARYLPGVLRQFAMTYPQVQVDVFCSASPELRQQFDRGELDIILTTEETADRADAREIPLTWIMAERGAPLDQRPLPLALFHAGCLYRRNTLAALENADIPYRIAYGSPSLAGVLAAVAAGLAVAPVTADTTAPGCRLATPEDDLPEIAPSAIGLHCNQASPTQAATAFVDFLRRELGLMTIDRSAA